MFKSQEALIAEIHNEFDTAQDRLLEQAKSLLDSLNTDARMEDVATRLAKVGFTNNPTVKKVTAQKKLLVTNKEQAELIQHFKFNYPFLKFLTEEELDRICEKYSLIHAPVGNYIKDVPEKNLRDIEIAQPVKQGDEWNWKEEARNRREEDALKDVGTDMRRYYLDMRFLHRWNGLGWEREKSGLFIAAPESHFDLKGLEKTSKFGFRTEVKDPIVFRYVRGGIQVLTKWGAEAEDPSLVVEKLN